MMYRRNSKAHLHFFFLYNTMEKLLILQSCCPAARTVNSQTLSYSTQRKIKFKVALLHVKANFKSERRTDVDTPSVN